LVFALAHSINMQKVTSALAHCIFSHHEYLKYTVKGKIRGPCFYKKLTFFIFNPCVSADTTL